MGEKNVDMTFTGERFVPELRGQIAYEHRHRYAVALECAHDRDVLDIACGEGYGSSLVAAVARKVIGVDIDDASIRHAASRYPAPNLSFRVGSATAIPLDDRSIDVVVSFETLEHLSDQREMLSECVRVLRPDGRLLISSPNKLVYSDARGVVNPYHVRELYFDEFRDLLAEFFPEIRLYGQRIVGGSVMHPLQGAAPATGWFDSSGYAKPGIGVLPDPEYFIGMCGRRAGDRLDEIASVYLDPADDLLDDVRRGGLAAPPAENDSAAGRISEVEVQRDEARTALEEMRQELETARTRISEVEVQRDEARTALEEMRQELESARARISEVEVQRDDARAALDETLRELESTRKLLAEDEIRAAEVQAAFDASRARIAELEAARDNETAQRAELAREQDELRSRIMTLELDNESSTLRVTALIGEREKLLELRDELARVASDRDDVAKKLEEGNAERESIQVRLREAKVRVGSLERVRERLNLRISNLETELAEVRAELVPLAAERADLMLELNRMRTLLDRTEGISSGRLDEIVALRGECRHYRFANLELERHTIEREAALRRSGAVALSLGVSQAQSARKVAALELERLRLEFDLSVRSAEWERESARAASVRRRLASERNALAGALALRERRIAALETALRGTAEENVRALEAETEHYRMLNARMRESKVWKLRAALRPKGARSFVRS